MLGRITREIKTLSLFGSTLLFVTLNCSLGPFTKEKKPIIVSNSKLLQNYILLKWLKNES